MCLAAGEDYSSKIDLVSNFSLYSILSPVPDWVARILAPAEDEKSLHFYRPKRTARETVQRYLLAVGILLFFISIVLPIVSK